MGLRFLSDNDEPILFNLLPQLQEASIMLNISYASNEMKQICAKIDVAEQKLGVHVADALHAFLSDVEATPNAGELLEFHDEGIVDGDTLSFMIGSHYRATLTVVGRRPMRNSGNEIDWGSVQHMMIGISKC